MKKVQQGFTLIELMIVVAIIGILAAVAMPMYQNYTLKAKFTEVVNMTGAMKTGIELCVNNGTCGGAGTISGVVAGSNDVPPIPAASGKLASMTVSGAGVITATSTTADFGGTGWTYIMTPSVNASGDKVTWAITGTCKTRAGGAIC